MKTKIKKKIEKIVSSILILAMFVSFIPETVLAEDLYNEVNNIYPPDYVNAEILAQDTQTISSLASINQQILGINPYDAQQFSDWVKIGEALLQSKKDGTQLWKDYIANEKELSVDILEQIDIEERMLSKFDVRAVESLAYLGTVKEHGGAGREWLRIPNITKGYNVLSTKETSTLSTKNKTAKEFDPSLEDIFTEEEQEEEQNKDSSHSSGWAQAIDVSEIDYVRGSVLVYNSENKLVLRQKLPKQPIKVEWQTDYRPDESPFIAARGLDWLSRSPHEWYKSNASESFNVLSNMLADENAIYCDLPDSNPQVNGDNLSQMVVKNLGLVCYLQEMELPLNFEPGYDLEQSAIKLGQIVTENLSGRNLPASGLKGNNLKELEINTGKEWIGQTLGLPVNSLEINLSSDDLITRVGKYTLARKLNIAPKYLEDLTGNSLTSEDIARTIGRGYIEKILNLPPDTMYKESLADIKFAIGEQKANYIFGLPDHPEIAKRIDRLLGIELGKTQEYLWDNRISDYVKYVGETHINQFTSAFRPELLDSAYGVSSSTENVTTIPETFSEFMDIYNITNNVIPSDYGITQPIQQYIEDNYFWLKNNPTTFLQLINLYCLPRTDIVQSFLNGDIEVFHKIGINTLVRIFSADERMWPYYEQWLYQQTPDGDIETEETPEILADVIYPTKEDNSEVPVIYSDVVNTQFNLQEGDLERIFILNRAQEVFQRLGTTQLDNALTQTQKDADTILGNEPEQDIDTYSTFYPAKFQEILTLLDSPVFANPQITDQINQMKAIITGDKVLGYHEATEQDVTNLVRKTNYLNATDNLQKLLVDMTRIVSIGVDLEPLRLKISELIEGNEIQNPTSVNKSQIQENYSDYYLIAGIYRDNIYEIIQGDERIKNYLKEIGLRLLANNILDHPEENALISANNRVVQNYQQANATLKGAIGVEDISGEEITQLAAKRVNYTFGLKGDLQVSTDDIINFLNGAYISLASKVGAQSGNQTYKTNNFQSYLEGNTDGNTLQAQARTALQDSGFQSPSVDYTTDLFADDANIFNVGLNQTGVTLGINVREFYQQLNPNFDFQRNITEYLNSYFQLVRLKPPEPGEPGEIEKIKNEYINAFKSGNLTKIFDVIQTDSLANMYKGLDLDFSFDSFFPPSVMKILNNHSDDSDFIVNLDVPGYMLKELDQQKLNMSIQLFGISFAQSFKGDTNINPTAFTDFFSALLNPDLSQEDMSYIFAQFFINAGFLGDLPPEISSGLSSILSSLSSGGDVDPSAIANIITNSILQGAPQEAKDKLNAIIGLAMTDPENINVGTIIGAMGALGLPPEQLGQIQGVLGALEQFQAGNLTGGLSSIATALNLPPEQLGQLQGIFGALDAFQNGNWQEGFNSIASILNLPPEQLGQLQGIFGALDAFQNGNWQEGFNSIASILNLPPEQQEQIQGILGMIDAFQSGNWLQGLNQALTILDIPPEQQAQLQGIFGALDAFQNGNWAAGISSLATLANLPAQQQAQLQGIFGALDAFQNGNWAAGISSLATLANLPAQQQAQLQGIFGALDAFQNGNWAAGISSLATLANLPPEQLGQLQIAFSIVGSFQNGQFNPQALAIALQNLGSLEGLSDEAKNQLQTALGLLSVFNGQELNPAAILSFLEINTNLLDNLDVKTAGLMKGVFSMALSALSGGQKIDPIDFAKMVIGAMDIKDIQIPGLGSIPITALLDAFNNPQGLVKSIISSLITNYIIGALGLTPGGLAALIVAAIISALLDALFGGSSRTEYYFTACGFYPKFDDRDGLMEESNEKAVQPPSPPWSEDIIRRINIVQYQLINSAKQNALTKDNDGNASIEEIADAWGEYIRLREKYDMVPTDEIQEDDLMTQDIKYSQEALTNEQTEDIANNDLTGVVNEAESKNNDVIECMDPNKGGGGVFANGENPELSDDQKKQMAKYKIKVYLGNLLKMYGNTQDTNVDNYFDIYGGISTALAPNSNLYYNITNWLIGNFTISKALAFTTDGYGAGVQKDKYKRIFDFNTSGFPLRPTQIYTYDSEDLKQFYVLRDKLWGDTLGTPGSQDMTLAEGIVNEGFGYNQKMWDRIHYGY